MDPYFPIIMTQNLLLCLVTICFICHNSILGKADKRAFYLPLILGALITVCDFVGTVTVGRPELVWLQCVANSLNLSLTPMLPTIPILIIARSQKAKVVALVPSIINLLLLISGQIYTVSTDGSYHRNPLFLVFTTVYLFNMLHLAYRSMAFSVHHQNHNISGLLLICLFMLSSTTIQIRLPQIHLSWFCVSVTVLLYFIYYTDVLQQMDALTGLLNRNSFQNYCTKHKRRISGIVMIDMDGFKEINDTYGHLVGDQFLAAFGKGILRSYQRCGNCYRLGGDEFCILMGRSASHSNAEKAAGELESYCKHLWDLPCPIAFSYGYQSFNKGMDITECIALADKNMYALKVAKKAARE